MTFREFMVLLRLYRAAPPDLRRWADKQLPGLQEAAELTEGRPARRQTIMPFHDSTCPPLDPPPKLDELIRRSIEAFDALPPEEKQKHRRAQRISWVYGNLALSNPNITREMVEEAAKDW
jgi:hypothetical protein